MPWIWRGRLPAPAGYDQDLVALLKALIAHGVPVRASRTPGAVRCIGHHPFVGRTSTMPALAEWVMESDKVLTFNRVDGNRASPVDAATQKPKPNEGSIMSKEKLIQV